MALPSAVDPSCRFPTPGPLRIRPPSETARIGNAGPAPVVGREGRWGLMVVVVGRLGRVPGKVGRVGRFGRTVGPEGRVLLVAEVVGREGRCGLAV